MTSRTRSAFALLSLLTLAACDTWADTNDPACEVRVVGVRGSPTTGAPWVALQIQGKTACGAEVLAGIDVRLWQVEDQISHGAGTPSGSWTLADGSTCAIYTWPEAASVPESWGVTVTPELGHSTGARGFDIPFYAPGTPLPAWRNLETSGWELYLDGEGVSQPDCVPN
jgi:hypothetical protein